MRISILIVSFCAACIFYICNADWIDDFLEEYLGSDHEEVAPFISSITAGTDEFDRLVKEMGRSKWRLPLPFALIVLIVTVTSFALYYRISLPQSYEFVEAGLKVIVNLRKSAVSQKEIQTLMTEFLERRFMHQRDDVPVKLLWKGGSLKESSVHCNVKEDSKMQNVLHSKLYFKAGDGDKRVSLTPSRSETSTARKMEEIRKMLESEQEIRKSTLKEVGTETRRIRKSYDVEDQFRKKLRELSSESLGAETPNRREEPEIEWDEADPKLMNRIRLLESRLRLEELKNKNWIDRMTRAEGILQQLNKQVERIEETRPVGTLTETLKITSTVTNWPSSSHPRRNMQFTLVNLYPPYYTPVQYTSLSELIKKEVGLPSAGNFTNDLYHLSPTPQIPSLPSPTSLPQGAFFLSKFLSR